MSISDPKLIQLESAQNQLISRQREVQRDIEKDEARLRDELERVQKDWGGRVERSKRIAEEDRIRLAKVTEDIERRRTELKREEDSHRKKAA